jgi:hypothetical protein
VWGGDVDDIDVGVVDELMVAAIGFGGGGGFDVVEEVLGAGLGGRGGSCDNDMFDVGRVSCGGAGEEVF